MTRRQLPDTPGANLDVVLAPRSATDLFDSALEHYRNNFATYLYTMVLAVFPIELIQKFIFEIWFKPALAEQFSGVTLSKAAQFYNIVATVAYIVLGSGRTLWPGLLGLFLIFVGTGACSLIVAGGLELKPVAPKAALIQCTKASGRLLVCASILGVAASCSFVVGYLIAIIVGSTIAVLPIPAAAEIGTIIAVVLGYILTCIPLAQHCFFAIQIVLIEGKSPWRLWDRNCILIRQLRLRNAVAAFASLPIIVVLTALVVLQTGHSLLTKLVINPLAVHISAVVAAALQNIVVNLMVIALMPYVAIVTTLLYYDYRIRREALDLRVLGENPGSRTSNSQ